MTTKGIHPLREVLQHGHNTYRQWGTLQVTPATISHIRGTTHARLTIYSPDLAPCRRVTLRLSTAMTTATGIIIAVAVSSIVAATTQSGVAGGITAAILTGAGICLDRATQPLRTRCATIHTTMFHGCASADSPIWAAITMLDDLDHIDEPVDHELEWIRIHTILRTTEHR